MYRYVIVVRTRVLGYYRRYCWDYMKTQSAGESWFALIPEPGWISDRWGRVLNCVPGRKKEEKLNKINKEESNRRDWSVDFFRTCKGPCQSSLFPSRVIRFDRDATGLCRCNVERWRVSSFDRGIRWRLESASSPWRNRILDVALKHDGINPVGDCSYITGVPHNSTHFRRSEVVASHRLAPVHCTLRLLHNNNNNNIIIRIIII